MIFDVEVVVLKKNEEWKMKMKVSTSNWYELFSGGATGLWR